MFRVIHLIKEYKKVRNFLFKGAVSFLFVMACVLLFDFCIPSADAESVHMTQVSQEVEVTGENGELRMEVQWVWQYEYHFHTSTSSESEDSTSDGNNSSGGNDSKCGCLDGQTVQSGDGCGCDDEDDCGGTHSTKDCGGGDDAKCDDETCGAGGDLDGCTKKGDPYCPGNSDAVEDSEVCSGMDDDGICNNSTAIE